MSLSFFDARWYLDAYPDVAADPFFGTRPAEHYQTIGRLEGRNPNAAFDEAGYRALNRDVAAAVEADIFASGYDHFVQYGQFEGRTPGIVDYPFQRYTTEQGYLAANPDVAAAVRAGDFVSGFEHYVLYGQAEGRGSEGGFLFVGGDGADGYRSFHRVPFAMAGGEGDDTLEGGGGIWAGAFVGMADRIDGGPGDDLIAGGPGDDTLTGGPGADVFVFATPSFQGDRDVIADFQLGVDGIRLPAGLSPDRLTITADAGGVTIRYELDDPGSPNSFQEIRLLGQLFGDPGALLA